MRDSFARHHARLVSMTMFVLAVLPGLALAQPFAWSIPSGVESWSTGHVHTILWTGGPASNVNIYLIQQPMNVVAQVVVTNDVNDGERQMRLAATLTPGTYQFYIEDTAQTTWTYGPQFHIATNPDCVPPCTGGALGAPALVCGQTQAQAEALATALAQSYIACGMAGDLDLGSVQIETTLLSVGAFPCPSGYSGAYAVEASAIWCCCPRPVNVQPSPWSLVKSLYGD
jgi:hypothetical protein